MQVYGEVIIHLCQVIAQLLAVGMHVSQAFRGVASAIICHAMSFGRVWGVLYA